MKMKEYHKSLDSFETALKLDPNNYEAITGKNEVKMKISAESSNMNDEERLKHAMSDPEIQQIMSNPQIQLNLKKMQEDPMFAQQMYRDPEMRRILDKLIAAGIIKTK